MAPPGGGTIDGTAGGGGEKGMAPPGGYAGHSCTQLKDKNPTTREESDRCYTRILRLGKNPTVTIQES